jgi:positive regulator of sigma E activity
MINLLEGVNFLLDEFLFDFFILIEIVRLFGATACFVGAFLSSRRLALKLENIKFFQFS